MACLHPWARRPSPPWRAWVNCGPILCLAWRIISLHGIHGIYWDIYIYIWIYHEYQWWYIMDILMVHDGNWLLIIIFIFRMGNPLLRESLLGILLFFWEVLKQIQVRAWFLLPAVSNQNLELFHILGWWTQRKQLFVWGLLEYKDLDTYRVDRNDGLPRDLEPKMVINLWYILCIFVYAYIYIYTFVCVLTMWKNWQYYCIWLVGVFKQVLCSTLLDHDHQQKNLERMSRMNFATGG